MTIHALEYSAFRADAEKSLFAIVRGLDRELERGRSSRELQPGAALFFGHLSLVTGEPRHRAACEIGIDQCAYLIAQTAMDPRLYGGLAGFGWLLAHLDRVGVTTGPFDLSDVDAFLIDCINEDVVQEYDLISGITGLGAYFLERLPDPAGVVGIEAVTRSLARAAERGAHGYRWLTPPERISPFQIADHPAGKYDLGMAHGVPGVIALHAAAHLAGVATETTRSMLAGALRWLLVHQRSNGDDGFFGTVVDARTPDTAVGKRAAWCYGDLGIAVSLLLAADALADDTLRACAHDVALAAAALAQRDRAAVRDASLCHGAAGLGYVFEHLGRAFDDAGLARHGHAWYDEALAWGRFSEGVGGYAFARSDDGRMKRSPDPSFLQGASGIGLAILHALHPESDSSWDRLLLMR